MNDRESMHSILDVIEARELDASAVLNWTHRGDYDSTEQYARGNVVVRRGTSYVAVSDLPCACPGPGWQVVASIGERGDKGDKGDAGQVGKAGTPGPPGQIGPPGRSIYWRGRYMTFYQYQRDDVVMFEQSLWIALQQTETIPKADQINWDLMIRLTTPDLQGIIKRVDGIEGDLNDLTTAFEDHSDRHEKPDGEDQIASMMYFVSAYAREQQVIKGAVVNDDFWLMHANKDTSDRAAPQPLGPVEADQPDAPTYTTDTHVGQVQTGGSYTLTRGGWVKSIDVWIPTVGANIEYTALVLVYPAGGAEPVSTVMPVPNPVAGQWNTVAVGSEPMMIGDRFEILLRALNSASNTVHTGDWIYLGDQNGDPGLGELARDKDNTLSISKTDDNGADRSADLAEIIPGTIIDLVDKALAVNSRTYYVTNPPTDDGTFITMDVERTNQTGDSLGGAEDEVIDVIITIPVAQPTEYVEGVGYWSGNQPSWATVEGVKEVDGAAQLDAPENAYGVRVYFQPGEISPDWDFMAYSGG